MEDKHGDFYRELRRKVRSWAESKAGQDHAWLEYLLLVPDVFHLLTRLMFDPRVNSKDKLIVGLAIAYFVSPIDLLPESFFGTLGYLDDLAVAALALNRMTSRNKDVVREHWAGEGDVIELIEDILGKADQMLGGGVWSKITDWVDSLWPQPSSESESKAEETPAPEDDSRDDNIQPDSNVRH